MSGDYSRWSFDAQRDFTAVLMQQGRVHTDGDWNEWLTMLLRRIQAGTFDTFGPAVVPRTTPDGFRIEAANDTFTIGRGRMYVDGLLAENHGGEPLAWDPRLAEEHGTAAVPYADQPYYPDPPDLPEAGPHLVYLKVWQRELTHVEAPELVEKALGVDTTTRLQTVWQVRVLPNPGPGIDCSTPLEDIPAFNAAEPSAAGRLTTGTADIAAQPDPCLVPPTGGYKGLENQLYRVEIHREGDLAGADRATFKWSRDNASVASRVTSVPSLDRIVVESIGRDALLRFSNGDWIEITDDAHELAGLPGLMRRIAPGGVDDATRTIVLATPLPAGEFPADAQGRVNPSRHTRVRRWDQRGRVIDAAGNELVNLDAAGADGSIPVQSGAISIVLEHGVVVTFDLAAPGGRFRSGDYWLFAARTADASVEELDRAPPLGMHAHYAKLALVTFPGAETDCRIVWPPQVEGHGCDCTVCVTPESHASGALTIQSAIDQVKAGGGTVCLGPGTYPLRDTVRVDDARSIRIRGQGPATVLLATGAGAALEVTDSNGVTIENLAVISAATAESQNAVRLRRSIAVHLERLSIAGLSVGDARSIAIGLDNVLVGLTISRCLLFAHTGLAGGLGESYVAAASLLLEDNALLCAGRGVALGRAVLHLGETRVAGNTIVGCDSAGISLRGGALPNAAISIAGNVCVVEGDGIVCGLDAARIAENDVRGTGRNGGRDGIVIAAGLDAEGIDDCQILANRIRGVRGYGIALRAHVASGMIKNNVLAGTGGGIVMEEDGAADVLVIENNQLLEVAAAMNEEGAHLAAIQLVAVEKLDVVNNAILAFARAARQSATRAGVRSAGIGIAGIAGNRISGLAPPEGFMGVSVGIEIFTPFTAADVCGNDVRRRGGDTDKLGNSTWIALAVRAPQESDGDAPGRFVPAGSFAVATAGASTFLFTATRLRALARPQGGDVGVRGNAMETEASDESTLLIESSRGCTLSDNRIHAVEGRGVPSRVRCRRAVVSSNDLRGRGDAPVLDVHLLGKGAAAVLGNVRSGEIFLNGNPLPAPWPPLNPFTQE